MDIGHIIQNVAEPEKDIKGIKMLLDKAFVISEKTSVQYRYISKKAERIGSVILILVNDFEKEHPIHMRLSDLSLSLIDAAAAIPTEGQKGIDSFRTKTRSLSGVLSALGNASILPGSSVRLLLNELEELAGFAEHTFAELGERQRPDLRSFLAIEKPPSVELDVMENADASPRLSNSGREQESIKDNSPKMSVIKDNQAGGADSPRSIRQSSSLENSDGISKKKDRRAVILSMLQRKDVITVKDVTGVITDCSEKTVQRELLALVAQGVLKKQGERRWSAYSLA